MQLICRDASSSRERTTTAPSPSTASTSSRRADDSTRRAAPTCASASVGELARRVGEDADPHARGLQAAKRRAGVAARAEVDRRAVGREALEQRPPVAEPLVEHRRRGVAVLRHVVELDAGPPRRVLEPVAPERPRVREHCVEIEGDRLTRSMLDSRSKPASGKGTPVQVRDGPAAVRGDASPPRRHWAFEPGKAVEKGAPSQKTCRPPRIRTPRGRRIRASPFPHRPRDPRGRPRRIAPLAGCGRRPHPGRRQDADDLRRHRAARVRHERPRRPAERGARRGVLRARHDDVVRPVRRPDRLLPGRRRDRLGVQGERRLAAGRRRPGEAERRRPRALVLRAVRHRRRPVDARPAATAPGCYRAVAQDDQGAEKVPPGLVFHVGAAKTVPAPAGPHLPEGPHGLVWASAPGAVRSNRLP